MAALRSERGGRIGGWGAKRKTGERGEWKCCVVRDSSIPIAYCLKFKSLSLY
jgi:hypothetical protein